MTTDHPPSEALMSEYIKGFDAGYSYVLNEIERYIDVYPVDVFAAKELLAHLKMEGKPDIRESPYKYF